MHQVPRSPDPHDAMHGMWWYPRIHGSCGLMYCCITYYAVLRTTVLGATTTYTITVMVYVYGWLMVSVLGPSAMPSLWVMTRGCPDGVHA